MKVLLVDAYDSFIYIIDQYLRGLGCETTVVRSGTLGHDEVAEMAPGLILLGPGPGHPRDSGHVELIQRFRDQIPQFGICLGHQALGLAYGATVTRADHLLHGKTSEVLHDGRGAFWDMPQPFPATRYHSLIVTADTVQEPLQVTATSAGDGYVMALRHRELPLESVQFHPESIRTDSGRQLLGNVVQSARTWGRAHPKRSTSSGVPSTRAS